MHRNPFSVYPPPHQHHTPTHRLRSYVFTRFVHIYKYSHFVPNVCKRSIVKTMVFVVMKFGTQVILYPKMYALKPIFQFCIRREALTRDLLAHEKWTFCLFVYSTVRILVKKNNMVIVPMYNFRFVIYTWSKPYE